MEPPLVEASSAVPDLWISILQTGGMLLIVLGILVAALYLMKRFMHGRGAYGARGAVQVLASYYIGPKQRVVVIDVMGEKLVVGVTPQSINCLGKISGDAGVQLPDGMPTTGFRNLFKNKLKAARDDV